MRFDIHTSPRKKRTFNKHKHTCAHYLMFPWSVSLICVNTGFLCVLPQQKIISFQLNVYCNEFYIFFLCFSFTHLSLYDRPKSFRLSWHSELVLCSMAAKHFFSRNVLVCIRSSLSNAFIQSFEPKISDCGCFYCRRALRQLV